MYDSYKEGTDGPGPRRGACISAVAGSLSPRDAPHEAGLDDRDDRGSKYNVEEWHAWGGDLGSTSTRRRLPPRATRTPPWSKRVRASFCGGGSATPRPLGRWKGPSIGQKFRDEGLILVEGEPKGGTHAFRERTPKSYAFQQFAGFVRPGWVRLDVPEAPVSPLVAAFRKEDGREVAVVLINSGKVALKLDIRVTGVDRYRLGPLYVTDRTRHCERSNWSKSLTPESVTTLLYSAEAVPTSGESKTR